MNHSWRRGLLSVLFWTIIAAAFIGPGTVTTAAAAGARFGYGLVWALAFSILATAVLQEAAARLTLASGKNLGEIIALRSGAGGSQPLRIGLFLAVALGCAAYQAGNLLGALAGISFFSSLPRGLCTLLLAALAALLLWMGQFRIIARMLALVVAGMGLAFVLVALRAGTLTPDILTGMLPRLPEGSGLVVLGLVGTTIVPYNLFLGSGISSGQSIREMRVGVWLAVLIGGLISMAILLVGTTVGGPFDFTRLGEALVRQLGGWAMAFLGFGLFAAGFSSAVTAPLAAAVTGRSMLGTGEQAWSPRGRKFRTTWGVVLGIGTLFGLLDVQPVPVIILAQAVNGLLLPVVALFLFFAINDRELLGTHTNGMASNVLMLAIVGVVSYLGLVNVWKAVLRVFPSAAFDGIWFVLGLLTLGLLSWAGWSVWRGEER